MTEMTTVDTLHGEALARAADQAVRAIPPAWPLTATVAVNPFLGQITETLDQTAARLARIGGVRLALPRKHYAGISPTGRRVSMTSPPTRSIRYAAGPVSASTSMSAMARLAISKSADISSQESGGSKQPSEHHLIQPEQTWPAAPTDLRLLDPDGLLVGAGG